MQPTTEGGTACATGAAAGSTSSSSGGSCSSSNGASGTSGRATIAFREAHVRLALHPEVDQRRRQTKNTIRIDLTGAGGGTQTVTNRHSIDEHFKFPVSHDHLDHKTLRFQVLLNPLLGSRPIFFGKEEVYSSCVSAIYHCDFVV